MWLKIPGVACFKWVLVMWFREFHSVDVTKEQAGNPNQDADGYFGNPKRPGFGFDIFHTKPSGGPGTMQPLKGLDGISLVTRKNIRGMRELCKASSMELFAKVFEQVDSGCLDLSEVAPSLKNPIPEEMWDLHNGQAIFTSSTRQQKSDEVRSDCRWTGHNQLN